MPKIKAVVAAVGQYGRPDWKDLWGASKDADTWTNLLKASGLGGDDIRLVLDDRCTKASLLERLNWLGAGATAGDRAYFIYCGHGTQFALRNEEGKVGRTGEALVPHDFAWDDPLTDEMLGGILGGLAHQGVDVTAILDCCHSGGLDRSGPANPNLYPVQLEYPRDLPIPRDIAYRLGAAAESGVKPSSLAASLDDTCTVLYACSKDEKAWETWANGDFRGVFSFACEKAIREGARLAGDIVAVAQRIIIDRGFVGPKQQTPRTNRAERALLG